MPRFHLARTEAGNFSLFRHDVSDRVVEQVRQYVEREPALDDCEIEPVYRDAYIELLSSQGPVDLVWGGPAYRFPNKATRSAETVVAIDEANAHLLEAHMSDWLPDVPHRQPFVAVVEAGHAVSVCASVRITPQAHEAGVETASMYRGKGHAAQAVAAWSRRIQSMGAEPIYSTSWSNRASLAVANMLGLQRIGADFHIR